MYMQQFAIALHSKRETCKHHRLCIENKQHRAINELLYSDAVRAFC